jgi:hypothetical protein
MVDKVALRQAFLRNLPFSSISLSPAVLNAGISYMYHQHYINFAFETLFQRDASFPLKTEAARLSETTITICETARCLMLEDLALPPRLSGNINCHFLICTAPQEKQPRISSFPQIFSRNPPTGDRPDERPA